MMHSVKLNRGQVSALQAILQEGYKVELTLEETAAYGRDYVVFFGTLAEIALAEKQKLSQNGENHSAPPL